MISDGETKHSAPPHREESHAFPLLNKSALIGRTGTSGESGDCFKPLFGSACIRENASPRCGLGVSSRNDEPDAEESVRRKCYERGFSAGRQDACSLVREETAPQVMTFAEVFGHWNDIMMRIEENSCLQTLKIALAVAEKVLGAPARCATGRLESLEAELKARIRQSYQLDLKMNPDDMEALSSLMGCADVHWGQWTYITAAGDKQVQKGELQVQSASRTILADDPILRSLDALLSEASTK